MDIDNYEGLYSISNLGNIKRHFRYTYSKGRPVFLRELVMKVQITKAGYKKINLIKESLSKTHLVHRLVANAFIENCENKPCINHKDLDKGNNYFINLEWVTYKENNYHSRINQVLDYRKGERHHMSRLTKEEVLEIRDIGKSKTTTEIGEIYNINYRTVSQILNRTRWKHI